VVEVLVLDAARTHLEQHQVAGFPFVARLVDDRVTFALEDEDHEAALVTVPSRTLGEHLQEALPVLRRGVLQLGFHG